MIKSVVSHVKLGDLVCTDNWSQPYARMIDGRTIFQYLLFIEPKLRSAFKSNKRNAYTRTASGTLEYQTTFYTSVRVPNGKEKTISSNRLFPIPVIGNSAVVRKVSAAVELIDGVGLGFFLDFGLSEIVLVNNSSRDPDVETIAESILGAAANSFLILWVNAENKSYSGTNSSEPARECEGIFRDCILIEFRRRLGKKSDYLEALENLKNSFFPNHLAYAQTIDSLTDLPLTRELIAYWFPLWNRAAIIFDSPFDTMNNLDQLTTDRPSWSKPA